MQFKIDTLIWHFVLSLNELISLHSRVENRGKQHSQWSGTETVAAFDISLTSVNVWNYFKGRSDSQQGLVTPVTIRSWTKPWELAGSLTWTCWSPTFPSPGTFQKTLLRSSFIHSCPLDRGPRSCPKQTVVPGAFFVYGFLSIPPYVIVCLWHQLYSWKFGSLKCVKHKFFSQSSCASYYVFQNVVLSEGSR